MILFSLCCDTDLCFCAACLMLAEECSSKWESVESLKVRISWNYGSFVSHLNTHVPYLYVSLNFIFDSSIHVYTFSCLCWQRIQATDKKKYKKINAGSIFFNNNPNNPDWPCSIGSFWILMSHQPHWVSSGWLQHSMSVFAVYISA